MATVAFSHEAAAWELDVFPSGVEEDDSLAAPALYLSLSELEGARPLRACFEVGLLNLLSSEERFAVGEETQIFANDGMHGSSSPLSLQHSREPANGWLVGDQACALVRILGGARPVA